VLVEVSNVLGGQEGAHELRYLDFSVRAGGVGSFGVADRREPGVYGVEGASWSDHHPSGSPTTISPARYAGRTL
jgi:hypothetical protein